MAVRVRHLLNAIGYAFYNVIAPSERAQALVREHRHWPVFFVTPQVFSGSVCGKLHNVFLFKSRGDLDEAVTLEHHLAAEGCSVSFEVFPATENGLFEAAEQRRAFVHCFPIRI